LGLVITELFPKPEEDKKEIKEKELERWNLNSNRQNEPLRTINYHTIEKTEKVEGKIELVTKLAFSKAIPELKGIIYNSDETT